MAVWHRLKATKIPFHPVTIPLCLLGFGGTLPVSAQIPKPSPLVSPTPPRPDSLLLPTNPTFNCSAVSRTAFYGHLPYTEASQNELAEVGYGEQLRSAAAVRFRQMQVAAAREGISLVPLSGFRDRSTQNYLFYSIAAQRGESLQQRARVSAPPGHSEHHTGYAIDIGDGSNPWYDFSQAFDQTAAGQWLMANAWNYGFELSFPHQHPCVSYEPWHWRFVGDRDSQSAFQRARELVPGVHSKMPLVGGEGEN